MAYGNWGGNSFKNGNRMRKWEDNTPYRENELEEGYQQAFGQVEGIDAHHCILGELKVRLCGYKSAPILYIRGERQDNFNDWYSDFDKYNNENRHREVIEVDGESYYIEVWSHDSPEAVYLILKEPNGNVWKGFSGYGVGAGYDEADVSEQMKFLGSPELMCSCGKYHENHTDTKHGFESRQLGESRAVEKRSNSVSKAGSSSTLLKTRGDDQPNICKCSHTYKDHDVIDACIICECLEFVREGNCELCGKPWNSEYHMNDECVKPVNEDLGKEGK